jgi:hypothetical protein
MQHSFSAGAMFYDKFVQFQIWITLVMQLKYTLSNTIQYNSPKIDANAYWNVFPPNCLSKQIYVITLPKKCQNIFKVHKFIEFFLTLFRIFIAWKNPVQLKLYIFINPHLIESKLKVNEEIFLKHWLLFDQSVN